MFTAIPSAPNQLNAYQRVVADPLNCTTRMPMPSWRLRFSSLREVSAILLATLLLEGGLVNAVPQPHLVIEWNNAALQGVRDAKMGAPMAARALAIVHTCMYDAWAAYDEHAVGTQLRGALRRPADERTQVNKERAISYAAYRALA